MAVEGKVGYPRKCQLQFSKLLTVGFLYDFKVLKEQNNSFTVLKSKMTQSRQCLSDWFPIEVTVPKTVDSRGGA